MKNYSKLFLFLTISYVSVLNCSIENFKKQLDLNLSNTSSNSKNNDISWKKTQAKTKDTVVQLFVQNSIFNWLEPHKSPLQTESYGSGFFIDDEGYIVSNYHVVDEAVDVKIQIPSFGKERFEVEVIGVCPDRDISLLKLTKKSFADIKEKLRKIPYLKLGNSDKVFRTQEILALGYPLGQEKLKATQGIVSGREREWGESYIQITAALNEGSSGGPSINKNGEIIGINTAGISKAQNVGYIVPINDVKNVIQQLHKIKFLRKPFLGGEFNYATKDMINFLKNPKPGGLYFSRIYKDTLLEKAGVKEGDMLYEINNHKIDMYGETNVPWAEDKISILDLINRFTIGEKINLIVYRKGKKKQFDFKFELLKQLPIRTFYPPYEKTDYEIIGGIVVMQLALNHISKLKSENRYLVKYWKRKNQYEPKLIITHIFPDSQTQKARVLGIGEILTQVNGKKISTIKDFRNAIKESKKTGFLTIKNEDKEFTVSSLEKIVKEEDDLASTYFFKKSKLFKEFNDFKPAKKKKWYEIFRI